MTHFRAGGISLTISLATSDEREEIYRIRHLVYAEELGQHPRGEGRLRDALDDVNLYICASENGELRVSSASLRPGAASLSTSTGRAPTTRSISTIERGRSGC